MSRYFMYGTSLGGIEQLMMLAPNFPQRRSGIVINNHFNCEGGIKICNGFNFEDICLKEINTDGYALYQTAKTISTGNECIKINELADKELIDDFIFKAIINSSLINRYG